MDNAPSAPELTEREKLAEASNAEKKARAQRVFERIQTICKEENCQLIAYPKFRESSDGFTIVSEPAILPL